MHNLILGLSNSIYPVLIRPTLPSGTCHWYAWGALWAPRTTTIDCLSPVADESYTYLDQSCCKRQTSAEPVPPVAPLALQSEGMEHCGSWTACKRTHRLRVPGERAHTTPQKDSNWWQHWNLIPSIQATSTLLSCGRHYGSILV